jgi:HlyD family secretion protein
MKRSALVVLGLALLATGCGRGNEDGRILASGHVEATEVRLSTKVGGTLEHLAVDEGTTVEAGQEIARIDTVDEVLTLESAKAELALAKAELSLRLAGTRREDILEAQAQLVKAEADLAGAARDLERMEGLLASGSGTTKARDDARTRRDVTAAAVQVSRERLRRLEAGFRAEEKAAARARVQAAEARIAQVEQQIEDAVILSPVGGVVTQRLSEEGELMAPGGGIVVVTDLANAWLNAFIPAPDLGRIRLGQEAEVTTDDGQTRKGRLSFIATRAEFTPKNVQTRDERIRLVFRIKVALDNADGLFKPGMPAEARLEPTVPAR